MKQVAKPGTGAPERFRIVVSDGTYSTTAMLATQLNVLAKSNELRPNCIILLEEFISNTVSQRK